MGEGDDDGMPPLDVVPAHFAVTKRKREGRGPFGIDERFVDRLRAMKGAEVEVTSAGIHYRGLLVGADEQDLYLRAVLRWLVLPLDRVTHVRRVDDTARPMGGPPTDPIGEEP